MTALAEGEFSATADATAIALGLPEIAGSAHSWKNGT